MNERHIIREKFDGKNHEEKSIFLIKFLKRWDVLNKSIYILQIMKLIYNLDYSRDRKLPKGDGENIFSRLGSEDMDMNKLIEGESQDPICHPYFYFINNFLPTIKIFDF